MTDRKHIPDIKPDVVEPEDLDVEEVDLDPDDLAASDTLPPAPGNHAAPGPPIMPSQDGDAP